MNIILDGCICKLAAGVIEVLAPPGFNILTKRKITDVMRLKAKRDRRFKWPQSMTIEPLVLNIPTLTDAV